MLWRSCYICVPNPYDRFHVYVTCAIYLSICSPINHILLVLITKSAIPEFFGLSGAKWTVAKRYLLVIVSNGSARF